MINFNFTFNIDAAILEQILDELLKLKTTLHRMENKENQMDVKLEAFRQKFDTLTNQLAEVVVQSTENNQKVIERINKLIEAAGTGNVGVDEFIEKITPDVAQLEGGVALLLALSEKLKEMGKDPNDPLPPLPVIPAAPAAVVAQVGDGQVTIGWDAVPEAVSYNIYRSEQSGVTKSSGVMHGTVSNPSVEPGLMNGTPYFFVVTAVNLAGESVESSEVSAIPAAP